MNTRYLNQRGITLIEILLVAVIVAASIVGVFLFTKNARLTAAVNAEQTQVEQAVKTIHGLFANQSSYGALSADYLNEKASGSGLVFTEGSSGEILLNTSLESGRVLAAIQPSTVTFPASGNPSITRPDPNGNGFAISYSRLSTKECVNLSTALGPSSILAHAKPHNSLAHRVVALRGKITEDKTAILAGCKTPTSDPTALLVLYFQGTSGATLTTPSTPLAQCRPTRETQSTGCPAGQSGSIVQERVGNCTGPGNSLVYTAWTTIEDTCVIDATQPPDGLPDPIVNDCTSTTFTRATACPSPQTGQILETRTVDGCANTSTPWSELSRNCSSPPPVPTCNPSSQEQTIACPPGQGGSQVQTRSSSCATPSSTPVWSSWSTISNNCTSSCAATGTCCTPQRQVQTVMGPCPAGTYGNSGSEQERFLGCVNSTTQAGSWTAWQNVSVSASCTACPASVVEDQRTWVNRSGACPPGLTGTVTYQAEQARSTQTSYVCPAGTATLPTPTTTTSAWADTGNRRNVVENCTSAPINKGYTWVRMWGVEMPGSFVYSTSSPSSIVYQAPLMGSHSASTVASIRSVESGWISGWIPFSTPSVLGGGTTAYRTTVSGVLPYEFGGQNRTGEDTCTSSNVGQIVMIQDAKSCTSNLMGGCMSSLLPVGQYYFVCSHVEMPSAGHGWLLKNNNEYYKPMVACTNQSIRVRGPGYDQTWTGNQTNTPFDIVTGQGMVPMDRIVMGLATDPAFPGPAPLYCDNSRRGMEVIVHKQCTPDSLGYGREVTYACNGSTPTSPLPPMHQYREVSTPTITPASCSGATSYSRVQITHPNGNKDEQLTAPPITDADFPIPNGFFGRNMNWGQPFPATLTGKVNHNNFLEQAIRLDPRDFSCGPSSVGAQITRSVCLDNTLKVSSEVCSSFSPASQVGYGVYEGPQPGFAL